MPQTARALSASEFVLGESLAPLQLEWLAARLMRRRGIHGMSFDESEPGRLVVMHDVTGSWPVVVRDYLALLDVHVVSVYTHAAQSLPGAGETPAEDTGRHWLPQDADGDTPVSATGRVARGIFNVDDQTFRWAHDDTGVLEVWNWRVGRVCVDVGQADLELLARAAAQALIDDDTPDGEG